MAATRKVAALGGGHGLHASLTALRRITDQLTAIVTVADDGGSSGRLRHEFDCLPPGDLRMAFAALCGDDRRSRVWSETLQWRFAGTGDLGGHPVGNILLLSLWQLMDDPVAGLAKLADLLHSRGRVLPMALEPMQIEADVLGFDELRPDEVSVLKGQAVIAKTTAEVLHVRLLPSKPAEAPETIEAVRDADYVVLGPGSWFTSVIPHLLVPQLSQAILTTDARRILMLNLAPADETDGATVVPDTIHFG
ncbi:MAG: hypothetical protein CSA63_01365 [Propionibacterium sp.]|nr:MAG: hypothetical protein CSA63_01365 [Propionibacterium sp.]